MHFNVTHISWRITMCVRTCVRASSCTHVHTLCIKCIFINPTNYLIKSIYSLHLFPYFCLWRKYIIVVCGYIIITKTKICEFDFWFILQLSFFSVQLIHFIRVSFSFLAPYIPYCWWNFLKDKQALLYCRNAISPIDVCLYKVGPNIKRAKPRSLTSVTLYPIIFDNCYVPLDSKL